MTALTDRRPCWDPWTATGDASPMCLSHRTREDCGAAGRHLKRNRQWFHLKHQKPSRKLHRSQMIWKSTNWKSQCRHFGLCLPALPGVGPGHLTINPDTIRNPASYEIMNVMWNVAHSPNTWNKKTNSTPRHLKRDSFHQANAKYNGPDSQSCPRWDTRITGYRQQ